MAADATVQSALRALAVIEALNQHRVTSLEVLHGLTGLPKSTLVRLLETLIAAGYVVRVSRRDGYALTDSVLLLSAGVRHRDVLVDIARPALEAFTRKHQWQVSLATSERDSMLVRATTRDISPFAREEVFLNRRVGMLRSAIGQAYFAFCSAEERRTILKLVRTAYPEQVAGIGGPKSIAAMVEKVRRDGYAAIVRPPADATRSMAVPVLEAGVPDRPLGAIVMFYYHSVMSEAEAARKYLGLLNGLAAQIAQGMEEARRSEAVSAS
jgi:IclR family mhp operon transcriptional activator